MLLPCPFEMLVITFKALNGLGPGYLKEYLVLYVTEYQLRATREVVFHLYLFLDIQVVATRLRVFCGRSGTLLRELPATRDSLRQPREDEGAE